MLRLPVLLTGFFFYFYKKGVLMTQSTSTSPNKQLGPLRSFFWPIYSNEVRKLLPMFLMVFLICFSYNILRNMKDAIVVTSSGAEVIPFIKVWALLPMAVLSTILFTKLSNHYSQQRVFNILITIFLSCFVLFAFVIYPFRDYFHPHALADKLEMYLPLGFKGLISMFRYWTYTVFYVMSELWATIVLNVLFWGFANEVTRVDEARRFYGVFGIGANLAAVISGLSANSLAQVPAMLGYESVSTYESWGYVQMVLITVVTICGLGTMAIFRWMNLNVLNDPSFDQFHTNKRVAKEKGKLSFRESFTYLSNSKYLICIAAVVISYNLVINLVEIVWKDQLRNLYPNPADFNNYTNNLTTMIGIVSTLTALCMAKIISRYGWTKTAMITPIVMLITGVGFFSFLLFKESAAGLVVSLAGTTPLVIAVFFGGAQNCLSKAAKYSVFDATTNIAYIPLSHESKLKGKAAIDGVGSRLGKSGSSFICQGLLLFLSTLSACVPYIAGFFMIVISMWFVAVRSLGRQFNALTTGETPEVQGEKPAVSGDETVRVPS